EPAVIATAFGLKSGLPDPVGVYANQPNPWQDTRRGILGQAWKFLLAALALQAFFLLFSSEKLLLRQDLTLAPQQGEVVSKEFELGGKARKLAVRNQTSLDNSWLALDLLLVNKTTGQSWPAGRELSYYSGYDDGYWSEGSNSDEVVFQNIPPGTYYLTVDPDLAPDKPVAIRDRLEVATAGAGWSNFLILLLALVACPLLAFLRHAAFESSRWMESDHPPSTGDSSDGDDD